MRSVLDELAADDLDWIDDDRLASDIVEMKRDMDALEAQWPGSPSVTGAESTSGTGVVRPGQFIAASFRKASRGTPAVLVDGRESKGMPTTI